MLNNKQMEFVRLFISQLSSIDYNNILCNKDICQEIFIELSRQEEIDSFTKDCWGNWDFAYCRSHIMGNLFEPWLDHKFMDYLLPQHCSLVQWPEKKPFAICLSHDMDVVSHSMKVLPVWRELCRDIKLQQPFQVIGKKGINLCLQILKFLKLKDCCQIHDMDYYKWLELENTYGFRSTFFVFPQYVSNPHVWDCTYKFDDMTYFKGRKIMVRDMIREIDQLGWEIGLHGSINSAIEPGMLLEEKEEIESLLGHKMISVRQHYLRYDASITPVLQTRAGFLIDSTQGFNRSVGFRAGTSIPYPCWDHKKGEVLPIWEIPQHIMDGALFTNNALDCDEDLALQYAFKLMDAVEKVGGCLTLSWHPHYMNQPKWWNVYEALLAEGARRNAWGCSVGDLYRWWTR